ncbi:hypothetical protein OHC33_010037 [Knufia fluminis]|uniref:Uncharacterized protein n=1 Tax=Knufia fluminis TaxID=191047 RepID=A0AAN8I422_9EURO|nr:hypothetical protein OHC33_010037 [Knufia fluminis]
MEAAGLASAILTFLDITAKILTRTREFLDQAEQAPAFLKALLNRLPVIQKSLQLIDEERRRQRVDAAFERKLFDVVEAAQVEIEQLNSYVSALIPQNVSSRLQRFDRAVKSVLVYEAKISSTLERLDQYSSDLILLQVSIVTSRTGRAEESTLQILQTLADNKSITEAQCIRDNILAWFDGMPRDDWVDLCLMRRSPGSAVWIFEKQVYEAWMSSNIIASPTRFLWIHGPAGCGKTFLAANVFECFESHNIETAAVFWRSGDRFDNATLDEIPRSWVTQLLLKNATNYRHLEELWKASNSRRASSQEVWQALKSILTSTTTVGITLLLDGLDSYREQQAKRARSFQSGSHETLHHAGMRDFFWLLKDTLEGHNCRFVCFSRPDGDIRSQISPSQLSADCPFDIQAWQYAITANDLKVEFSNLAFDMLAKQLPKKSYAFRLDLADHIAEQAEGHMSITMMLHQVSLLKPTHSEKKVRKMLEQPLGFLDDIYQTEFDRIKRLPLEDHNRACRMLRWIVHAIRPLNVQELLEAILIEADLKDFPDENFPDDLDDDAIWTEIQELCGRFVAFNPGEHYDEPRYWTVRLAHPAAKRFLCSKADFTPENHSSLFTAIEQANLLLGSRCIYYMMYDNVWPPTNSSCVSLSQSTLPAHPFLAYATRCFKDHFNNCPSSGRTRTDDTLLEAFLDQRYDKVIMWHRWKHGALGHETLKPDLEPSWDWGSRLAFSAAMELSDVVRQLLASPPISSSELSEALCAACWSGSTDVMLTLLKKGADVDHIPPSGDPPLHVAAFYGKVDVVSFLIGKGANLNVSTNKGGTALHHAIRGGHEDVIRVLLMHGADAMLSRPADGYLPIHVAAQLRNLKCLSALISTDSLASRTVNAIANQGWSALGIAVSSLTDLETDRDIAKLLIDKGADSMQQFPDGRNAFYVCAEHGNYDLFQILATEVEELRRASGLGYTEGRSLLHAAVIGQHSDIVQTVLEVDANWSRQDNRGQTAFDLAEPLQRDVRSLIASHIAKTHNGRAFLINRLTASPPEDPDTYELYLSSVHLECLDQSADIPELLVQHLQTCQNEYHVICERMARTWRERRQHQPSP